MKLSRLIAPLVLGTMLFAGCEKNGNGEATELSVSETTVTKDCTAQDFVIDVTTDAKLLNVTVLYDTEDSQEWLTASYAAGKLSVSITENVTIVERSATIRLSVKGVDPATVQVVQAGAEEEGDPFASLEPVFEWDDSWTVWNWMYNFNDGEGGFNLATYKWSALAWAGQLGKGDLNGWNNWSMVYENSGTLSLGLMISPELLQEIGGKPLGIIEFCCDQQCFESAELQMVTVKKSEDKADTPSWKRGKCYDVDQVLYTCTTTEISDYGWVSACPEEKCLVPESGDVMMLIKIKGDGGLKEYTDGTNTWYGSLLSIFPQPVNKFAPTYINLENNEGREMYPLSCGTINMNFRVYRDFMFE